MQAARFHIRRALAQDVASLVDVGRQSFTDAFGAAYDPKDLAAFLDENYSEAVFTDAIAAPHYAVWIALDGERLVGFGMFGPNDLPIDEACSKPGSVKRLYLLADVQGCGLGSQILELGLSWLKANGYAPIFLSAAAQNIGAQRLYARYGFVKVKDFDFMVGAHADAEFLMRLGAP